MIERDDADEPTPIEPDQPDAVGKPAATGAGATRTGIAERQVERQSVRKNAVCFACGYERFDLEAYEPCPACGKNPNMPRCTFCGYELVGLMVTENCPECGKPVWDSNVQPPTSGLSIASMVLGIVSLVSCMLYGIPSLVLGPLAIIFGEIAVRQQRKGMRGGNTRGFALTGRICGWIGFAAGLIFAAIIVWVVIVS